MPDYVVDMELIARSPIIPASPAKLIRGWEISNKLSNAELRLIDCSAFNKTLVRTQTAPDVAHKLSAGRSGATDIRTRLVAPVGAGEWLILDLPNERRPDLTAELPFDHSLDDLTHSRAMIRIYGEKSSGVISKLCAVDLAETKLPNGFGLRTSVAGLVCELIRDDYPAGLASDKTVAAKVRSYIVLCDRSAGQYLFDSMLDAGREFGIDIEGLATSLHASR